LTSFFLYFGVSKRGIKWNSWHFTKPSKNHLAQMREMVRFYRSVESQTLTLNATDNNQRNLTITAAFAGTITLASNSGMNISCNSPGWNNSFNAGDTISINYGKTYGPSSATAVVRLTKA
jgi:hypothetical protein